MSKSGSDDPVAPPATRLYTVSQLTWIGRLAYESTDPSLDDDLRERMRRHLAEHSVRTIAPDDRKRAAVAIVVVDSHPDDEADDPAEVTVDDLSVIPGDISGLDGRMQGVSGGAAFLLAYVWHLLRERLKAK